MPRTARAIAAALLLAACDTGTTNPPYYPPDVEDYETQQAVKKCENACPLNGHCIWSDEWDSCVCRLDSECMASDTCKAGGNCWCKAPAGKRPICYKDPDWDKPKN